MLLKGQTVLGSLSLIVGSPSPRRRLPFSGGSFAFSRGLCGSRLLPAPLTEALRESWEGLFTSSVLGGRMRGNPGYSRPRSLRPAMPPGLGGRPHFTSHFS